MDENIVKACPECDSAVVTDRDVKTPRYRCAACGETFEEAVRRPSKRSVPTSALQEDLRRVADELGKTPSPSEYDELGEHGSATIQRRIGWTAAVRQWVLGLDKK